MADPKTVEDLLNQNELYSVPVFQRSYSWKESHTAELFEDIVKISNTSNNHFIGSMVFVSPKNSDARTEIIDGQQRFATIVLILCALKHVLKTSRLPNANSRINTINNMIYVEDNVTLKKNIRLELNREDKSFLESIIEHDIIKPVEYASHGLIKKAYDYFVSELEEKILADGEGFIQKFLETLLRKLSFIKIDVDSSSDAFELFETLNDRGLELSVADLVKNYLLSIPGESIEEITTLWKQISDQLEEYDVTRFLRHLWSSKYNLIRKEELYKAIKTKIDGKNLKESMQELYDEAVVYRNLRYPTHEDWNDVTIEKALEEINLLGVEQIYVILLAVYNKFYITEKAKFTTILNALLNLSFRYNTIWNSNPNKIEIEYSTLAIGIRNGTPSFEKLYNAIKDLEPPEEEFKESFKTFETKSGKLAKYILIRVNDSMLLEKGVKELDTNKLNTNLEHIIPKKPNQAWLTFFKDKKIEDYTTLNHRIGNMTILVSEWNSSLKNKFFDQKVTVYKKSDLPLNEDLKSFTEFGTDEVNKRQNMIGMRAEKLWKNL